MTDKIDSQKEVKQFIRKNSDLITEVPDFMIKQVIPFFLETMTDRYGSDMKRWTATELGSFFQEFIEKSHFERSQFDADAFYSAYEILNVYVMGLSEDGRLGESRQIVDAMLGTLERSNGLYAGEQYLPEFDGDYYDDGWSAQRENAAREISRYITDWLEAYFESPAWTDKRHGMSRDALELAVSSLADVAYSNYQKTPKTWTKTALEGVMVEYWIGHTDLTEQDFENVADELLAFLDYAASQQWISARKLADYHRYILAIKPEMIAASKNRTNFGSAKKISQELARRGIDVTDQDAVNAFIADLNSRGGIDALDDNFDFPEDEDHPADTPLSLDDDSKPVLKEILDNPTQLSAVANLYDPDPQQHYLTQDHLPELDGREWRKKAAIKAHHLGVELGLRYMATSLTVAQQNGYGESELLSIVVEVVDTMYAQYVQRPDQWAVAAWSEFGQWLRDYSKQDNRGIRQATMLATLASVTADAGVISRQAADRLSAAILGEPVPAKHKPTNVKGKVISMKQARKMLKEKKKRKH